MFALEFSHDPGMSFDVLHRTVSLHFSTVLTCHLRCPSLFLLNIPYTFCDPLPFNTIITLSSSHIVNQDSLPQIWSSGTLPPTPRSVLSLLIHPVYQFTDPSQLYANVLKIKDVKLSAEDKDTLAKIMSTLSPRHQTHVLFLTVCV